MKNEKCGCEENVFACNELHGNEVFAVQRHIKAVCNEAGLNTMAEILGIVQDRENVQDAAFLKITAEDITKWYDYFIGPAIDKIEDDLLECEK